MGSISGKERALTHCCLKRGISRREPRMPDYPLDAVHDRIGEYFMSSFIGKPHIVEHQLSMLGSGFVDETRPEQMNGDVHALEIERRLSERPVVDFHRIHIVRILERMRGEQTDPGRKALTRTPDHVNDVFFELGAIYREEGVVHPEMDQEDVGTIRLDVLVERPDSMKRVFPAAGAVDDFQGPPGETLAHDVYITSCSSMAGRDTPAADENSQWLTAVHEPSLLKPCRTGLHPVVGTHIPAHRTHGHEWRPVLRIFQIRCASALPNFALSIESTVAGSILIQREGQLFEGDSCTGFSSMIMACTGQASTHRPQPMHFPLS